MIQSILFASTLVAALGAQDRKSEDLEARWRREYPIAVAELERAARNFSAKGQFSFRFVSGTTARTNELTVAASDDKKVYICDRQTSESPKKPKTTRPSSVHCWTDAFAFHLTKESPADPYVLVSYGKSDEQAILIPNLDFDLFARSATVFRHESLLKRMQSPSFVFKGAKSVRDGDTELIQIDYGYEMQSCNESGAVFLDPEKSWAISKATVLSESKQGSPPMRFESKVEYQKIGEHVYFPKRMEFFGKTPKADRYEHALVELSEIEVGTVRPEIFTLKAYGLPDIPLSAVPAPSSFSFRNPLFWGALTSAIVSFTLLRVMRPRGVAVSRPVAP